MRVSPALCLKRKPPLTGRLPLSMLLSPPETVPVRPGHSPSAARTARMAI
mgnify:CR=1 FL=1